MENGCQHKWLAYSHPPLRAVAGRKCTSCGLDEPADVDDDEFEVELREGETDLQCAERRADELEAANYEWGADFQTLLFVAVREVRRLRHENARLKADLETRDMQLGTHKELLAQAEAKSDELRARWDRAETAREELQKLVEQTRAIATQRVQAVHVLGSGLHGPAVLLSDLQAALKPVSDSREPKL